MLAYLVSDGEFDTSCSIVNSGYAGTYLFSNGGFSVEQTTVQKGDLASCVGLFRLLGKKARRMRDERTAYGEINRISNAQRRDGLSMPCRVRAVLRQYQKRESTAGCEHAAFFMTRPDWFHHASA
jgi:hypothetical protein